MANILNNQVVPLTTIAYGGIDPYSPCVQWYGYTGGATANAFPIFSGSGTTPSANTPYIISANIGCSSGTGVGVFSGTFVANGYTGLVAMWVNTFDGVGASARSNTLTYTSLAAGTGSTGPLQPYAGADRSASGYEVVITDAGITGGTPPYHYRWFDDTSGYSPLSFTPSSGTVTSMPTITIGNIKANGEFFPDLIVTDSAGHTATDYLKITQTTGYNVNLYIVSGSAGSIEEIRPSYYFALPFDDNILPSGTGANIVGNQSYPGGSLQVDWRTYGTVGQRIRIYKNGSFIDQSTPLAASGTGTRTFAGLPDFSGPSDEMSITIGTI